MDTGWGPGLLWGGGLGQFEVGGGGSQVQSGVRVYVCAST